MLLTPWNFYFIVKINVAAQVCSFLSYVYVKKPLKILFAFIPLTNILWFNLHPTMFFSSCGELINLENTAWQVMKVTSKNITADFIFYNTQKKKEKDKRQISRWMFPDSIWNSVCQTLSYIQRTSYWHMLKCNIFVCQFKERLKTQKGEFTL